MKLITLPNLSVFADEIKARYARKAELESLSRRIDDLATVGGEPNVIAAIKVNGVEQEITEKAVDISVPAKISELSNDRNYQTAAEVAAAMAAADHLKRKAVGSVEEIDPLAPGAAQYIYMVPKTGKDGDQYDEYMVIEGKVERVGDWAVDLSGYMKMTDVEAISSSEVTALLAEAISA